MKLGKLYSLRKEFTIIGLTGRVGSGCTGIANKLSQNNFITDFKIEDNEASSITDNLKLSICYNYLKTGSNWEPFKIINYRDVLLFHLIHEANKSDTPIESFIDIIFQNGENEPENKKRWINRFDKSDDESLIEILRVFLTQNKEIFNEERKFDSNSLNLALRICLKKNIKKTFITDFFFGDKFQNFSLSLYTILNTYNITKRTRLFHDLANNLRAFGQVKNNIDEAKANFQYIYTIAETINRIIKAWRINNKTCKIVIDSLKNSLELMFFKEKFAGFYMIATNKEESVRRHFIINEITKKYSSEISERHALEILNLDDTEYKSNDHKKGKFSTPDIENCIQKSDYHLFINTDKKLESYYLSINHQLVKLIALINQPGIITPTGIERTMQVAYNAKFNSGCISRQVGAAITDEYFTIKSIGWNDVPQGQIPCNLRSAEDLINQQNNQNIFSDFEKHGGEYDDGKTFREKFSAEIYKGDRTLLNGRNCSFCFKTFHNAFEGEKNQVHTRSLHAEENAMLQITKYGGQALKGGNLFTTASPCELCSKKAYQLGIKNIYYIDPYPGIATQHTLKNGSTNGKNPNLIMFQGAVGRAFHKLYEPFMAYKDEISILTGINPKTSTETQIRTLVPNKELRNKIIDKIKDKSESEKKDILERWLSSMLEKTIMEKNKESK